MFLWTLLCLPVYKTILCLGSDWILIELSKKEKCWHLAFSPFFLQPFSYPFKVKSRNLMHIVVLATVKVTVLCFKISSFLPYDENDRMQTTNNGCK